MSKVSHALLTDALCYLHSRQIVHRDIKPSNIFLHEVTPENMALKMGDFGLRYTHFDSFSLSSLPLTVFMSVFMSGLSFWCFFLAQCQSWVRQAFVAGGNTLLSSARNSHDWALWRGIFCWSCFSCYVYDDCTYVCAISLSPFVFLFSSSLRVFPLLMFQLYISCFPIPVSPLDGIRNGFYPTPFLHPSHSLPLLVCIHLTASFPPASTLPFISAR